MRYAELDFLTNINFGVTMATKRKKGVSRKKKGYAEKDMPICRPTPPNSSHRNLKNINCTSKQFKILKLINDGHNNSEISRKFSINESSVRRSKALLVKKNLLNKLSHGVYSLSKLGRELLKSNKNQFGRGVGSPASFPMEKNIHNYHFVVNIKSFPKNWEQSNFYYQSLKAKDFFLNKSTKQLHLYFDSAHIRIDISKKKITFFIPEQTGSSFDEIQSKCFDIFVMHYKSINAFGFNLSKKLSSNDPHFANPKGFFSQMASHCTDKLFKIDAGDLVFWIDRSLGPESPEEETDSYEVAKRMEDLSNSALNTDFNFYDMEKCLKVVSELVKLQTLQLVPKNPTDINSNLKRVEYIG